MNATTLQTRATMTETLNRARATGWQVQLCPPEPHVQKAELRRGDDERLSLTAWDGGLNDVHCLHGQVATGLVSRTRVCHFWNSRITQAEMNQLLRRTSWDNNSGHLLQVSEGEYRQSWETASNYTVHRLHPGLYPIEFVGIDYQRTDDERPYYAIARVPTTEIRQSYVNRVFTASSAHNEELDRPSSILWSVYGYQLPDRADSAHFKVVPA